MNITFWLKLVGTALLIMIIDVALSILEVFVYSVFFQPGQPPSHYDDHALVSAPWVSGIAGGLQMYVFTYLYLRKHTTKRLLYTLALPSAYLLIDMVILLTTQNELARYATTIILATLSKYGGALLAYYIQEQKNS